MRPERLVPPAPWELALDRWFVRFIWAAVAAIVLIVLAGTVLP